MKKCAKFVICLVIQYPLFAQQKIDSLKNEFRAKSLPRQVSAALAISKYYLNVNIDSAGWYGEKALQLAKEIGDDNLLCKAYLSVGSHRLIKSSFNEALDYYLKAQDIVERQALPDSVNL